MSGLPKSRKTSYSYSYIRMQLDPFCKGPMSRVNATTAVIDRGISALAKEFHFLRGSGGPVRMDILSQPIPTFIVATPLSWPLPAFRGVISELTRCVYVV